MKPTRFLRLLKILGSIGSKESIRSSRLAIFLTSLLAGMACILVAAGPAVQGDTGSSMAVVPFDYALESKDLEPCQAFLLSRDEILVVLDQSEATLLERARLPEGKQILALGGVPPMPLWVTPTALPDEVAREAGVRIVHRAEMNTLFEAERDNAYNLLERGYFIVEVRFVPLSVLKAPHFGRDLAENLLRDRPLNEARKRLMRGIADSVNADSIRSTIAFLSYDQAASKYRSRFAARHEVRQDVTPYIKDMLASYVVPNGGTVYEQEFKPHFGSHYTGDDSIFVNVIAEKPGRKTRARYIICAHYDAIAVNDPEWNWLTDPAPGADDNATGVAGVLECARLLSGLDLDVGMTFIAFSGEELGLLGSEVYTSGLTPQDSILAVINFDMLGYVQNSKPRITLVYDWKSKWLSEHLEDVASAVGIDTSTSIVQVDLSGIHNSDHGPFWSVGIPANLLIEKMDETQSLVNPHYHTLGDTLGTLTVSQARDFVKLATGYISRFAALQADTLPDLVLTEGSIEWKWVGRGYLPFVAGDSLTAVVRALNMGGSMKEPTLYDFEIWQGDRSTGQLVYEGTQALYVLTGEYAQVKASWKTDPATYPDLLYTFVLQPIASDVESDLTNNEVMVSFGVTPQTTVFRGFHVFPNPVTDPATANLSFEILLRNPDTFVGQMEVRVSVFDLEGREVGRGILVGDGEKTTDIAVGNNHVSLKRVLSARSDLAPGLYFCFAELTITGEAGPLTAKSRFAVAR